MAEDCDGSRRTWPEVRCRKVVEQPASMATHHVNRAGENNAAWTKATRSAIVLVGVAALASGAKVDLSVVRVINAEDEAAPLKLLRWDCCAG
jgi:hypothetical protein